MKRCAAVWVLALMMAATGVVAWGQEGPPSAAPGARGGRGGGGGGASGASTQPAEPRTDSSTTTGTLRPAGRPEMAYTAVAGYLPLKDEHDKLRANMFYVSYTAGTGPSTAPANNAPASSAPGPSVGGAAATQGAPATAPAAADRPIMFVFNGGPGAASVWLHLGAVGPKRLDVPADGTAPAPPYHVVENQYSWLPATDLVFIDPVNTGYSRAATPEQAKEFFGVQEDIAAVGEFIRIYLTKHQRWGSPVFLAGESYGTTRAAGLADYLQERVGVSVSGVVLISTVLNFMTLQPGENNDTPFALYLPTYAAVAWYHKKVEAKAGGLEGLLKEAETFALNDYTAALAKGADLGDAEKTRVAQRLAELTGLSVDYVKASNLRVPPGRFEKELLRGKDGGGKVVGRFDGRIVGPTTDATADSAEFDPSLAGFFPAYTSAVNEYLRGTLKYENDISYEVLSNRTQPWNYGGNGASGYLYVGDNLRDAMTHNPHLRLLVCSGQYDLATPFMATDYTLSHMTLAPEIRKNITQAYYPAGHMVYHVRDALEKLYKDVTGFVEQK